MKNILIFVLVFLSIKPLQSQQQIATRFKTFDFNLNRSGYPIKTNDGGISSRILYSRAEYYMVKGTENIIVVPLDTIYMPLLHFIKKNRVWTFNNYFRSGELIGLAASNVADTLGTILLASTGDEGKTTLGDLKVVRTIGDSLNIQKLNKKLGYFGDVASGDVNQDGLIDVLSYGVPFMDNIPNNLLTVYLRNSDGDYKWDSTFLPGNVGGPLTSLDPIPYAVANTGYAVEVGHLFKNKYPEIIKGQYSSSPEGRYGLAFYQFNSLSNKYDKISVLKDLGVYKDNNIGTKIIRIADFNNDDFLDIVIHFESPTGEVNGLQIFLNDKKGNFTAGQSKYYYSNDPNSNLNFMSILIHDINEDGFKDIILSPVGGTGNNEPNFYIKNPPPLYNAGQRWGGIYLKNFILLNDGKGNFNENNTDISFPGLLPYFLKATTVNNQIKYIGFTFPSSDGNPLAEREANGNIKYDISGKVVLTSQDSIRLIDITVTFCNNLIKPTFNTNKFSFCTADSLNLSITNVNKGDTLKWHFGSKSDLTNVSNKTFTDSTKLFVTRTDSLGCMISSDTIQITKYAIPSSPTISRDTANNLVASSNGITWYKDGAKIADTTQKFKPTTNGLYTATTTQNGCMSSMSQSYYFLTSSLTNLANGEYIRISPNPTSGDIRVDYRLNTTTDLFISINDLNGRAIIFNQRIKPGSKINLRGVISGNYIVMVKDKAGRLITTQKILRD